MCKVADAGGVDDSSVDVLRLYDCLRDVQPLAAFLDNKLFTWERKMVIQSQLNLVRVGLKSNIV